MGISLGSWCNVWVHSFLLENINMFLAISRGVRRGCVTESVPGPRDCRAVFQVPHPRLQGRTVTHAKEEVKKIITKEVMLELFC